MKTLVSLLITLALLAQSAEEAQSQKKPITFEQLFTTEQQKAAGLSKLTAEEKEALRAHVEAMLAKVKSSLNQRQRKAVAKSDLGNLGEMVLTYQAFHSGHLPKNLKQLVVQGLITESMLLDPWGNPYQLVMPQKRSKDRYDIFSTSEKLEDESDDIGNWEE